MTYSKTPTAQKSTLRLHPNPVIDYFQISGLIDTAVLIISDLNCNTHLKRQVDAEELIGLETLKKGVYVARIITSTETIERKLVKE